MLPTEADKVTGGMSTRRQLESTPSDSYPVPKTSGMYIVNRAVVNCMICNTLAIQGSNLHTRRGNLFYGGGIFLPSKFFLSYISFQTVDCI